MRYEPLTHTIVQELSCDGLTYSELAEQMKTAGLSIEKIVYDPTRKLQNAFYADYENGLYCEVYLQRSYLSTLLKIATMNFPQDMKNELLLSKDWQRFYMQSVPVPMLIYDFQKRYLDIGVEEVFDVWLSIHTRIDYAKGLWRDEVLEYVFNNAPNPKLPEIEPDGRITVYRGMGDMSQPPEDAISWTTNPINALWFANRSGRGTKLLVTHVQPKQIVSFLPTFRNENEVILRRGTVTEYCTEDMIPVERDTLVNMLDQAIPDFILYSRIAKTLGYPIEGAFQQHGLKHIFRVLLLSLFYFYNADDDLTNADKQILIYFSLLHDIGRDSEYVDELHGDKSLQLIKRKGIRMKGIRLSQQEYRMIDLLIAYHCRDDESGYAAIQEAPRFSASDKKRISKLYAITKDIDGLDRVRFNGLDYRMLRTQYGKRLPLVAGCLLKEPLIDQLCSSDWGQSVAVASGKI